MVVFRYNVKVYLTNYTMLSRFLTASIKAVSFISCVTKNKGVIAIVCHSGRLGGWPMMQHHLLEMVLAGTLVAGC